MISLTNEQKKIHGKQKNVIYAKLYLVLMMIIKSIKKSEIIVITQESIEELLNAHDICNLRYKTLREITIEFHNGSIYDYHFIIKELTEKMEGQFECLEENTEKYITFSVPIKKGLDNGKFIKYKIKFTASFRFMSRSFSNLVDYLSKGLHDKHKNCAFCFDYMSFKDDQLIFRCFRC